MAYLKQQRPIREPTAEEFAWAAGFLEGEGSFTWNNGNCRRARVSAGQKTTEPLQRLLEFFGGRLYTLKSGTYNTWMLRGKEARTLMLKLRPSMSTRRKAQIDECLAKMFSVDADSKERWVQRSELAKRLKHTNDAKNKIRNASIAYWNKKKEKTANGELQ